MTYLDFELEIGPGEGREYPVVVVRSPAGEARETMHFPYDELALESRLDKLEIALLRSGGRRRRRLSPEQQEVRDFGREMFDALLAGEVRSRYDVSRQQAAQQSKGLRLKLRIRPPELAALPWEFLYDSRQAEYVCLSQNTPLVRYLELPQPIQPLAVTPPLRILGMIASPTDQEALNVDREKQRVETAFQGVQTDGLVELTWLEGQTWRDLQRTMRRGPWHIFHFIGHGGFNRNAGEGLIALANERGETHRLMATQLGRLLANHRSLRLALLNSCEGARSGTQDIFSSTASILVRRGIPAVLAMQYEITDRAAIELARTFYESLADGLPVDAALVEARTAISMTVNNTVEWGTPVLYMRSPDGVLFNIQEREVSVKAPEPVKPQVRPEATSTTRRRREPQVKTERKAATPVSRKPFEPEMILIPAGEFLMGSDPQKDKNAYDDEKPQHTLHLPDYFLAKTPVTNSQYLAFVRATSHESPGHWKAGKPASGNEEHPVVHVAWHDATAYFQWLAEVTGKPYRLPSEAEWEKGARGTDGRIYPWGNQWDKTRCNTTEGGKGQTTPVGAYPQGASLYGLLDMSGNVWEWTSSISRDYPYRADDGREDPTLSTSSTLRVLRGGAFYGNERLVRCASRNRYDANSRNLDIGFRMVVSPISRPSGL